MSLSSSRTLFSSIFLLLFRFPTYGQRNILRESRSAPRDRKHISSLMLRDISSVRVYQLTARDVREVFLDDREFAFKRDDKKLKYFRKQKAKRRLKKSSPYYRIKKNIRKKMPSMRVLLMLTAVVLTVYFTENCAGNPYPSIGKAKGKSKRLGKCA